MRSSITFKLFLAILASCVVVALAMGMAVRFSFQSDFVDYIHEREDRRLANLAEMLEADYERAGGWRFLQDDRDSWWRSLRLSSRGVDHERDAFGRQRHGGPPPRISLIDAQGDWLAGPRILAGAGMRRHRLEVNGQLVGWLVTPPQPAMAIDDEVDRRFQSRQLRATWVIVGLSALLAAMVSLMLARALLVPVRRIARATHRLAGGDYGTRVQVGATDELGRLAEDFNRLANSLERNERLRRDLMADVSHELRTPLAVLRGEIEALQDGLRTPDAATLASLQHEVLRLSALIDDLYDLSLADAGALSYRMQPLDLAALARHVAEGLRDRYARAGIDLHVDAGREHWVQGDERRLEQLMSNLLENTLRYTDAPGRARVTVEAVPRAGVRLTVEDSAPGVSAEALPRLFDRLFRVEGSRSRAHGGAGLGLAICRHIAQAHGGTARAMVSPLGGLRLEFDFPPGGRP
ncbi:ATP-binding protein [Castellaniella sp. S9]|uniref:ATP-binding protein n=1 Tax=Castellaniella sp. S9 TaxID=2993652 RepID=UPI0022B4A1E9|nr:ATP-binding protein [Castellaniella sp. S9]